MRTTEEFWSAVDRLAGPSECWPWTRARLGKTHRQSYGYLLFQGKLWKASRLALTLAVGPAPTDRPWALHSCDNPACCNPAHLSWGTAQENMEQMWARGRGNPPHPRGIKNPKAKLTEDQVRAIRSSSSAVRSLATEYGVGDQTIKRIQRRTMWSHLPD